MLESYETAPRADYDRHHIEANPYFADSVAEEKVTRHGFYLPPLPPRDRSFWRSEPPPGTGLDLHEGQDAVAANYQVYLSAAKAVIAFQNPPSESLQPNTSDLLAPRSEVVRRVSRGAGRHDTDWVIGLCMAMPKEAASTESTR